MLHLTKIQEKKYKTQKLCHTCKEECNERSKERKHGNEDENYCTVRDRCHYTYGNIGGLHRVSVIEDIKDQNKFLWSFIMVLFMAITSQSKNKQRSSKDNSSVRRKDRST